MRMLKQPGRRTDQETCGEADPGPSLSIFGLALPFPQKIREQAFSRFGQDRLRLQLDSFNRIGSMSQSHAFMRSGFRCDLYFWRQRLAANDQRVVTRCFERVW